MSTPHVMALGKPFAAAYARAGAAERFALHVLPVPGHATTLLFWDDAAAWAESRGLLDPPPAIAAG